MPIIVPFSPLPGLERLNVVAPMAPITFINGSREFSTLALVDSGAERGLISTTIAEELGIDWYSLPKYTGLTTSGGFTFHIFPKVHTEIFGHEFLMDINIAEGISPFRCILGRKDFFRRAKITFECYKNQFQIDFRKFN